MPEPKPSTKSDPPRDIRVHKSARLFELEWSPDEVSRLPFRQVRLGCRCAYCIDEHTGDQLLDPAQVPEDISVTNLDLVGNYALRIHWTDNHASGLFTWPHLRELGEASSNA